MKSKKIISVLMAALLVVSAAFVMSSCGKKEEEKKPTTLEEFVNATEGATEELQEISESMSNEILDGSCDVKGNSIVLTLTMKETYDSKYFESFEEGFTDKMDEYKDRFTEVIEDMEKQSGIDGVDVQVIVLNGDGTEIYSETYTK